MIPNHSWKATGREPWVCEKCGAVDPQRTSPELEGCLTADATPDDEATLTDDERARIANQWFEDDPVDFMYATVESILAGRVSGRADAAAQALQDAAEGVRDGRWTSWLDDDNPDEIEAAADWLHARAAQYREKGKAQ